MILEYNSTCDFKTTN